MVKCWYNEGIGGTNSTSVIPTSQIKEIDIRKENIEYKAPTYQVTNINDDINRNAASSINNNVFVNSMAKIDNSMVTKNGASSFFAKEKESPPLIIENNNIEKNT